MSALDNACSRMRLTRRNLDNHSESIREAGTTARRRTLEGQDPLLVAVAYESAVNLVNPGASIKFLKVEA